MALWTQMLEASQRRDERIISNVQTMQVLCCVCKREGEGGEGEREKERERARARH